MTEIEIGKVSLRPNRRVIDVGREEERDESREGRSRGDDAADVGGSFRVRDFAGKRHVLAGNVSSGRRSQGSIRSMVRL